MTVREYINNNKNDKKHSFWLCPNKVFNQSITPIPYLCGIEVSSIGFVPQEIIDKEVVKTWIEDGFRCIIWRNE